MPLKVLILGANGFIGSSLTHAILKQKDWEVYGMDVGDHKLGHCLGHPRFKFVEGDVTISREWIEYHVKKCDAVLPLVAIANPAQYVKDPLRVFELDFEANLETVRKCVKYRKRIIFPSTSEVYGMCDEKEFDEDNSKLVLGPIRMQRWIYSCIKQLLDRVIWAYGTKEGLRFTLRTPPRGSSSHSHCYARTREGGLDRDRGSRQAVLDEHQRPRQATALQRKD